MRRIDHPTAIASQFVEADPQAAQPATETTADWWNAQQNGLVELIEGENLNLAKVDNTQLAQAIARARVPGAGVRNLFANGGMEINQRFGRYGDDLALTPSVAEFFCDRWHSLPSAGSVATARHLPNDVALPNGRVPASMLEIDVTTDPGALTFRLAAQAVEDVRRLGNQVVTVSGYAQQTGSGVLGLQATQYFGVGGSAEVQAGLATFGTPGPTSSWTPFSATVVMPSCAGKTLGAGHHSRFRFLLAPDHGATAIRLTELQLELGFAPTMFERRPMGYDLALCRRYFEKSAAVDEAPSALTEAGAVHSYHDYGVSDALAFRGLASPFLVEKAYTPTVVWRNDSTGATGTMIFDEVVRAVVSTTGTTTLHTGYPSVGSLIGGGGAWARAHWEAEAELT